MGHFNSIGADVEVFAKDKDGHHVALCGRIGGTKENPLQVAELPRGYMLQEDNVSLEFNIPPTTSRLGFTSSIETIAKKCSSVLAEMDFVISKECAVSFDKKELMHPQALVFGCEPDYNAWKKTENERPYCEDESLRTCGGHIHVGSDIPFIDGVQNMDLFLGVPSILIDNSPSSALRRQLYGKEGAMRPKPYGWEYRVLSNFWIFKKSLINWVFTNTYSACRFNNSSITKEDRSLIQKCINTGDVGIARQLIEKYDINMA